MKKKQITHIRLCRREKFEYHNPIEEGSWACPKGKLNLKESAENQKTLNRLKRRPLLLQKKSARTQEGTSRKTLVDTTTFNASGSSFKNDFLKHMHSWEIKELPKTQLIFDIQRDLYLTTGWASKPNRLWQKSKRSNMFSKHQFFAFIISLRWRQT